MNFVASTCIISSSCQWKWHFTTSCSDFLYG